MNMPDDHPAVATLRAFFSAMKAWGQEMIDHHRSLDWDELDEATLDRDRAGQRKRREAIYEAYCAVGVKAKRLRDIGLSFDGDTPEYDPDCEPVESIEVGSGKVVVETRQTSKLRWRHRYELIAVGDAWRIRDNKKRRSDKNPNWRAVLL